MTTWFQFRTDSNDESREDSEHRESHGCGLVSKMMSLQGRNERTVHSGSENSRSDRSGASIEIPKNKVPTSHGWLGTREFTRSSEEVRGV